MSRHALKFFMFRDGLKKGKHHINLSPGEPERNPYSAPACISLERQGGIKTQSTTGATAQEEKAEFVTVTYENISQFILLLHVHGGQASTLEIF